MTASEREAGIRNARLEPGDLDNMRDALDAGWATLEYTAGPPAWGDAWK